jgi:hypothetical protein
VYHQHEQVPVGPGADQCGPDQRPGGQIEWLAGTVGRDRLSLPNALVAVQRLRQLDTFDHHGAGVGDVLLGHAVDGHDARPQPGMARDCGIQRPLQRVGVERAVE